jgi:trimeric autotransporter adhesin
MNQVPKLSAILVAASIAAIMGTAHAQQPPDVVVSDGSWNTAMGTAALLSVTPNSCQYCGIENTAAGAYAMTSNTSGGGNVAVGFLAMQFNITGHNNTGVGDSALQGNTTGYYNTAVGSGALLRSTTAYNNTGIGLDALVYNTTGGNNTASGANALFSNTTAGDNTATGYNALYFNTTGEENTASGAGSLYSNTTGYQNTASGYQALFSNTVGNHNTVSGFEALYSNTNGNSNTADGDLALYSNTTGYHNTASGSNALFSNTTGIMNVAFGLEALYSNTTGSNNIAVGTNAGYHLTLGSNNIDIGNQGVAGESGTVRIGTAGTHIATYIAGIENAKVTGAAVYVTSSGQLGVLASSERYKTAIAPMGANTKKLQQLRPVTFHLMSDSSGTRQYGLIAEEVNKVFPELVIRDDAGNIQGVRYDELAPMLLNEVQKQQQLISVQAAKIASLERQLAGIQAALVKLQPKDELVARR